MKLTWLCFVTLLLTCSAYAADTVSWREDTLTLDYIDGKPYHTKSERYWNNARAFHIIDESLTDPVPRPWQRLIVENAYLRLEIFPEAGGPVGRAIDKLTGHDLFFWEGRSKVWLPYWESGVKASFPYREHGVPTLGAPVSWRVIENEQGGITIAMWQEFSHNTERYHRAPFGRHSSMTLSQMVTLNPGSRTFSVRYHVNNPSPYRQGRQFWNDALFPRYHTQEGVVQGGETPPAEDNARFIFPAAWVSDHWGHKLRPWTEKDRAFSSFVDLNNSIFAWRPQYGFSGIYYPDVDVNRLRLTDPATAPGAKIYMQRKIPLADWDPTASRRHMNNFAEIWGGSDDIFELVEHWIEPGHYADFTYHFGLTNAIGEIIYSDERFAIGMKEEKLFITAWQLHDNITANFKAVSANGDIGPQSHLMLPYDHEKGTLTIRNAEGIQLALPLPLFIDDSTAEHAAIKKSMEDPHLGERFGEAMVHGRSLTLSHKNPQTWH